MSTEPNKDNWKDIAKYAPRLMKPDPFGATPSSAEKTRMADPYTKTWLVAVAGALLVGYLLGHFS